MEKTLPVKNRVTKNTLYTMVSHTWKAGLSFLLTPYIITKLGPERFGIWALVWVLVGYSGFLELGVVSALIKYFSEFSAQKEYQKLNQLINTSLLFYALIAAVIILIGFGCYKLLLSFFNIPPQLYPEAAFTIKVGILIFGGRYLLNVPAGIRTGLQRMDISSKLSIVTSTINALATVLILESAGGLRELIILSGLMLLISCVAGFVIAFNIFPGLKISLRFINKEMFAKLIRFGVKLHLNNLSFLVFTQTDKFLIAHFLNLTYVAFYALATRLVYLLVLVPETITAVLMPVFSELQAKKEEDLMYKLFLRSTKYLLFIGVPLGIFLFQQALRVIDIWLGPGYQPASIILQILLLGYFLNMSVYSAVSLAQGIGRPDWQMWSGIILMGLNIPLSISFFYLLGYTGIAWGTSLSAVAAVVYFYFRFFKFSGSPLLKSCTSFLVKTLLASVAGAVIILIAGNWLAKLTPTFKDFTRPEKLLVLIIAGLGFCGIYCTILKFLKYFDEFDKQRLAKVPFIRLLIV